jgi:hypothetical protein
VDRVLSYLPLIAILGPIIGAAIGAFVTYRFVVKRKRVAFYIHQSEDLTLQLRQHHSFVVFKIGNFEVLNLNRAPISVKNTGNSVIPNFEFDIAIPNQHPMHLAEKSSADPKLQQAIEISWDETRGAYNPTFKVKVPFFNPGETFNVTLFFDNTTDDVSVLCRMEEVVCQVRSADYMNSDTFGATILRGLVKGIAGVGPFEISFRR